MCLCYACSLHVITATACIVICMALAFGLKVYYDNKSHKWDIPPKKAEFPPEDDSPTMLDKVFDAGTDIVNLAQGNTDEVIANIDRSLTVAPNNAELYLKRGVAYRQRATSRRRRRTWTPRRT